MPPFARRRALLVLTGEGVLPELVLELLHPIAGKPRRPRQLQETAAACLLPAQLPEVTLDLYEVATL
jgi:hypothetical protein